MFQRKYLGAIVCIATASALISAGASPDQVLGDSDHKKLGREIAGYYEAKDEVKGIQAAFVKFSDSMEKAGKKSKDADLLALIEDWERALWYAQLGRYADKAKKGKVQELEVTRPNGAEVTFTYHLPKKYSSKKGPFPLVLVVPDDGVAPADALEMEWADAAGREAAILVACHMPADVEAWGELGIDEPGGVSTLMNTYGAAKDTFAADLNRVFLAGSGAGFRGATATAAAFPHLFAGIIGTGEVAEVDPTNFRNLAVLFIGESGGSGAYSSRASELGYENCTVLGDGAEADAWAWIGEQSRESYPMHLSFSPSTDYTKDAHWIRVDGVVAAEGPYLDAVIDREANSITIDADKIASVKIYFNDVLVDMDSPVKVIVNGTVHEQFVPRNPRTMLDLSFASGDWGRVFTNVMEFDVPAKDKG